MKPPAAMADAQGRGRRLFTIEAVGGSDKAIYVQRALLNGRPIDRAWLTHAEVVAGGRLTLVMGAAPSDWARRIAAAVSRGAGAMIDEAGNRKGGCRQARGELRQPPKT